MVDEVANLGGTGLSAQVPLDLAAFGQGGEGSAEPVRVGDLLAEPERLGRLDLEILKDSSTR